MPKEFQITGRPVSSNRVVHGAQNNDGMMAHPLLVNRRSSAPSNSHSRPSALSRIADGGFDISAFVDMSLFDDILGGHVFRGTIGNNRGGTYRLEVPSNGEPVFRISSNGNRSAPRNEETVIPNQSGVPAELLLLIYALNTSYRNAAQTGEAAPSVVSPTSFLDALDPDKCSLQNQRKSFSKCSSGSELHRFINSKD